VTNIDRLPDIHELFRDAQPLQEIAEVFVHDGILLNGVFGWAPY
jgi:hypothetical protein